jgi:hypothetical protein
MATLNENNFYVAIDSYNVSARTTDYEAGAGTDHEQLAAALKTTKLRLTLVYNDTDVSSYIQKLAPGIHTIELGPEGATSGKPRHVQSFLIESSPVGQSVKKTLVKFEISATGADTPSVDMFAGGVYS